MNNDNQKKL